MGVSLVELQQRAMQYAVERSLRIDFDNQLGFGNDGRIWASADQTALKVFERPTNYSRERNCYQRLRDLDVTFVEGLAVPQLLGFDDELLIVEMSIVTPPFLLDFGKAWLDERPDYSAEILSDWRQERSEIFGERWNDVCSILATLQSYGIFYFDAKRETLCSARREFRDGTSSSLLRFVFLFAMGLLLATGQWQITSCRWPINKPVPKILLREVPYASIDASNAS